jgi:hypothetical protein
VRERDHVSSTRTGGRNVEAQVLTNGVEVSLDAGEAGGSRRRRMEEFVELER